MTTSIQVTTSSARSLPLLLVITALLTPQPASAGWGALLRDDDGTLEEGERSYQDAAYRKLILIHGIFAALAFLLVLPTSVIIARFFKTRGSWTGGRWLKAHMLLNLVVVAFVVITFVTGYFAVGTDENVFDNPHHRIGLTIVVAVFLQAIFGILNAYVFYKPHVRTPIQNKLHIVLGWLTWGLAVANIAVGMVLYGSPMYLFILYAISGGLWLFGLFFLETVWGKSENHVKRDDYQSINWNGQVVGEKKPETNSPA